MGTTIDRPCIIACALYLSVLVLVLVHAFVQAKGGSGRMGKMAGGSGWLRAVNAGGPARMLHFHVRMVPPRQVPLHGNPTNGEMGWMDKEKNRPEQALGLRAPSNFE